jgi:hypothetical protein
MLNTESGICSVEDKVRHVPCTAPGVAEGRWVALRVRVELTVVCSERGRDGGEESSGEDGSAHGEKSTEAGGACRT